MDGEEYPNHGALHAINDFEVALANEINVANNFVKIAKSSSGIVIQSSYFSL